MYYSGIDFHKAKFSSKKLVPYNNVFGVFFNSQLNPPFVVFITVPTVQTA